VGRHCQKTPNTERNQVDTLSWREDTLTVCHDILLQEGTLSDVYIGPCGIFAISIGCSDPGLLYHALRSYLNTPHVCLCVNSEGLYDEALDRVIPFRDNTSLEDGLNFWTMKRRKTLDASSQAHLAWLLELADARSRGQYTDGDGVIHVLRGDHFVPTSDVDPNDLYWLTLYGSPLGLHRFYLGKPFTGLLYALTAGLFAVGSLLDLFCLLIGLQRDRRGRLIRTPTHLRKKLLAAPIGLSVVFLSLSAYSILLHMVAQAFSVGLHDLSSDPILMEQMVRFFQRIGVEK